MRKMLPSTTTALFCMAGPAVAFAQCEIINADKDKKIFETPELRAGYNSVLKRDTRDLRNAAMILADYGKDDACETVASAISDIIDDPKGAAAAKSKTTGIDTWSNSTSMEDRMASAVSLADKEVRLRADEVIGIDVYDKNGDSLGEVADIVFTNAGQQSYAVISYGGFLGLGEDQAAVPFNKLKMSKDQDAVFVDLTEDQFDSAPKFEFGRFEWLGDESWRMKNDKYYNPDS